MFALLYVRTDVLYIYVCTYMYVHTYVYREIDTQTHIHTFYYGVPFG